MAIFSDGGLISNKVNRSTKEPKTLPLGYDRVSKLTFGNREFFLNLVQYLCDDAALISLISKSWQLRLLDKVKVNERGSIIKWLNLILPFIFIFMGGVIFAWRRKKLNHSPTLPVDRKFMDQP
jgi:ABC-2 type transport system permease protein